MSEESRTARRIRSASGWMLVERYVESYPDDWRLVFERDETTLEVSVPEEVWRAFDGIQV